MRRVIGLDPGLRKTGWGVIEQDGNRLRHIAHGSIHTDADQSTAERLRTLHDGLAQVLADYAPHEAAVEETFVNRNASSSLKLGLARGVVLLAPALIDIPVSEYAPNAVKKAVVGAGHADKKQVATMVRHLLPGANAKDPDAADALAVAICHAHLASTRARWAVAAKTRRAVGA